jgi:type IV pilus assembly protein PilW
MMRNVLRSRGHTLLEVTIAVALGLVVTAGAVSLYRSQRLALARATDAAQIHESGTTALMLIALQLQMAGFAPADSPSAAVLFPTGALFGCSAGRPVGADDRLTCEALASHSDGIAIRYVADGVST